MAIKLPPILKGALQEKKATSNEIIGLLKSKQLRFKSDEGEEDEQGSLSSRQSSASSAPLRTKKFRGKKKSDRFVQNPFMMPLGEKPGYNSIRVQKAYRINGIEAGRLERQMHILERQKLHTVRIVNNSIRLTKVTLEHIEASSGHAKDYTGFDAREETESEHSALEQGENPMFLYGERKVSRRVGKYRRIQSAMMKGRSSSKDDSTESLIPHARPKSSIPTFSEIKVRVTKQLELDPEWDPNVTLPQDELERLGITAESKGDSSRKQAWTSVTPKPTEPVVEVHAPRPPRKQSAVSFKDERSEIDNGSEAGSDSKSSRRRSSKVSINSESATIPEKSEHRLEQRIKSAPHRLKKPRTLENDIKEEHEDGTAPEDSEKKPLRRSRSASVGTNSQRRFDHPMAKVVGKTQTIVSRAKKYRMSIVGDPQTNPEGPLQERERQRKLAKLEKAKEKQSNSNLASDKLVSEYLQKFDKTKYGDDLDVDNLRTVNSRYEIVRTDLQQKQILVN